MVLKTISPRLWGTGISDAILISCVKTDFTPEPLTAVQLLFSPMTSDWWWHRLQKSKPVTGPLKRNLVFCMLVLYIENYLRAYMSNNLQIEVAFARYYEVRKNDFCLI